MASTHTADDRYFELHGLKSQAPEALNQALQEAIGAMRETLYGPSVEELPAEEQALLAVAGAQIAEQPGAPDPLLDYATCFAALLDTSLTPAEAALRLGITPTRVRQLIASGALYAFRIDRNLRIPLFQFQENGLLPNLAPVNTALAGDLDPVSVWRWYSAPDPELDAATGPLSPLSWLKSGRDPEPVIAIARQL